MAAVSVLRADAVSKTTLDIDIVAVTYARMPPAKCRVVEFVDALPKSGAGKVMWRTLQEREAAK